MRRWVIAGLLGLGLALAAVMPTATPAQAAKRPLQISFHGQSFYILTTSKGTRIAFDPNQIADYVQGRPEGLEADIILISHNHNDHTRFQALANHDKAKILRGLKGASLKADWNAVDETIDDVRIRSVGVYHDTNEGFDRGKNAVFIVEADGWRIVHLGDLGHLLSPAQIKRIGPVDVLLIPVGGIYTLNGSEARKVMAQLKPKEYVFPMHYGTKVFDATLPPDEFYEEQDKRHIAIIPDENEIKLNKDPQRPRPLTVQLHYWPKEMKKK